MEMIKVSEFGFAPGNTPEQNSYALQQVVSQGGDILVDGKGIFEVSEPVVLGNGVNLIFEEGLYLKRQESRDKPGYVFVNAGAFTGDMNYDISVTGLKLICNGIQCNVYSTQADRVVPGLRGMLAFYHVENLTIKDFETLDLPNMNFAIHICDFKNILVEKVHIEGRKDGVHLGYGRGFVIRQCSFKTYDDPIALNAHDYSTSNPGLG